MKYASLILTSMILAGIGSSAALAEQVGKQPASQSAPANSPQAAGHDAQTGKPETGEILRTQPHAGSGQTKEQAETTGGASTERLDVPTPGEKRSPPKP